MPWSDSYIGQTYSRLTVLEHVANSKQYIQEDALFREVK